MFFSKLLRGRKKNFVEHKTEYCSTRPSKKALLYYKTDVFFDRKLANQYKHTNHWEILCIVRVLNQLGFSVDIIDRSITQQELEYIPYETYDLFLGIGAGNSGRHFSSIAQKTRKALKIFYAAGPDPDQSNTWISERYSQFIQRHPEAVDLKHRRTIDFVKITESMKFTDAIFSIGNSYTSDTYKKYEKPIHLIRPSSSESLSVSIDELYHRKPASFLYFGGNGHIVKGLDIVIEAFQKLPKHELFICGPKEPEFEEFYSLYTNPPKNIHWIGFVDILGDVFKKITSECSFIILPSCSEGIATSVTTCLRRGLIPLVTREAGINVEDFGYQIENPYDLDALRLQIIQASGLKTEERVDRMIAAYINSFQYTQSQFEQDITKGLLSVIRDFNSLYKRQN